MDFLQFLSMIDERIALINQNINGAVGNRISDYLFSVDKTGKRIHQNKERFLEDVFRRYNFSVTYPIISGGKVVTIPLWDIFPSISIEYFISKKEFMRDYNSIFKRRLEIAFENPVEYHYMNCYRDFDDFFTKQQRIITHNFDYPYGRK